MTENAIIEHSIASDSGASFAHPPIHAAEYSLSTFGQLNLLEIADKLDAVRAPGRKLACYTVNSHVERDGFFIVYRFVPKDGQIVHEVAQQGYYKNGDLEGPVNTREPDGTQIVEHFRENKRDGLCYRVTPDGALADIAFCVADTEDADMTRSLRKRIQEIRAEENHIAVPCRADMHLKAIKNEFRLDS